MLVEQELALFVLREQFGSCVEQCAKVFFSKGRISLADFLHFAKDVENIPEEEARKGAGILIHHKIIEIESYPDYNQTIDPSIFLKNTLVPLPQTEILYEIKITRILFRLPFPSFVQIVHDKLGPGEAKVLEILFLQGKASWQQIEELYAQDLTNDEPFTLLFTNLFKEKFVRKTPIITDRRVVTKNKKPMDIWEIDVASLLDKTRFEACINLITDKIDSRSGDIAKSFFALAAESKNGLRPSQQFFTPREIMDTLEEHFLDNDSMDESTLLKKYMELMYNEYQVPMVIKSLNQATYAINTDGILLFIRKKCAEGIISEILGPEALRIFRMLQHYKYMEEDQIAVTALIDPQEVRKILYRMMEYGLAEIQEVPGSNRTFYLWHVDTEVAHNALKKNVLTSILKLKKRLQYEKTQNSLLLEKQLQIKQDPTLPALTPAESQQVGKLSQVNILLNGSIQRLANIYLMLQFYCTEPI